MSVALTDRECVSADLQQLLWDLKLEVDDERGATYCANLVWSVKYEPRLARILVGQADCTGQISGEVLTLVQEVCYSLLPPCRNCRCICGDCPPSPGHPDSFM